MPTLETEIIQCENNPLWNQNCSTVSDFKRWLGLCSSVQSCIFLLTGSKLTLLKDGWTWNSKFRDISAAAKSSWETNIPPTLVKESKPKQQPVSLMKQFHPTPHRTGDNTTATPHWALLWGTGASRASRRMITHVQVSTAERTHPGLGKTAHTVPLRVLCRGETSGDVLMSPELPA